MHAILFGLKRAFQASLRLGRDTLRHYPLTPARFDMMHAVRRGTTQRDLREALGVSAPTVSRMLRSLEELGFVVRRLAEDARTRWVELTAAGERVLARVRRDIMDSGYMTLAVDCVLSGSRWFDWGACFEAKEAFEDWLFRVRYALCDRASLAYPWHPDD